MIWVVAYLALAFLLLPIISRYFRWWDKKFSSHEFSRFMCLVWAIIWPMWLVGLAGVHTFLWLTADRSKTKGNFIVRGYDRFFFGKEE